MLGPFFIMGMIGCFSYSSMPDTNVPRHNHFPTKKASRVSRDLKSWGNRLRGDRFLVMSFTTQSSTMLSVLYHEVSSK